MSTAHRVFVSQVLANGVSVAINGQKAHHLKNVLRIKPRAHLRLFNQHGEWLGEVYSSSKSEVAVQVLEKLREADVLSAGVAVAFAPTKHSSLMLEKATEIGADEFFPVLTRRTVCRHFSHARMQACIDSAVTQSERLSVPVLHELTSLDAWCASMSAKQIVFCDEMANEDQGIAHAKLDKSQQVHLLVGPEGGFAEEERAQLLSMCNVVPVRLGRNILRAETAVIAAISVLVIGV